MFFEKIQTLTFRFMLCYVLVVKIVFLTKKPKVDNRKQTKLNTIEQSVKF